MNARELINYIRDGALDKAFTDDCALEVQYARDKYIKALLSFTELYGDDREVHIFSVGGRTEISGNHTDHNCGLVLAAAVNLEIIAVAAKRDDGTATVKSEGYPADIVTKEEINAPCESKFFTSGAIIAGMQRAFLDGGYKTGGFDAYTTSSVLKGSGLSSSAAFEVMCGNIINHFYNNGKVDNTEIAKMAQFAENVYFGKPCGLMDQCACAVGGFISIDFKLPQSPVIKKVDFDLSAYGYRLCIVNTGGNHANLNEDYASVPAEMKAVAGLLSHTVLRETDFDEVIRHAGEIRQKLGDRALLRAFHFLFENERVRCQMSALENGNIDEFFELVKKSGDSSYKYLQNVYTVKNVQEQGLSLALCMTEKFFSKAKAAWRVHGGGFAGTIQVYLPKEYANAYISYIEGVFGKGSCHLLSVRRAGAICLA